MTAVRSSMLGMCSGAWLRPPDGCAFSAGPSRRAYETQVANERNTLCIPENPQGHCIVGQADVDVGRRTSIRFQLNVSIQFCFLLCWVDGTSIQAPEAGSDRRGENPSRGHDQFHNCCARSRQSLNSAAVAPATK